MDRIKELKKIESKLYKNLNFGMSSILGAYVNNSFKPTKEERQEYEQKLFDSITKKKITAVVSINMFRNLLKFHFGDSFGGIANKVIFESFASEFNNLVDNIESYNSMEYRKKINNVLETFRDKVKKFRKESLWNKNLKRLMETYKKFIEDYYIQEVKNGKDSSFH